VVRAERAVQHQANIERSLRKAMRNPQATERLRGDTAQPVGDTPAQYGAFIKTEQARWKQVVARASIKPD
jgi:tripartite-type tricarboxylate transporter receptor subunit TctC